MAASVARVSAAMGPLCGAMPPVPTQPLMIKVKAKTLKAFS
jgi:hypothetical protein